MNILYYDSSRTCAQGGSERKTSNANRVMFHIHLQEPPCAHVAYSRVYTCCFYVSGWPRSGRSRTMFRPSGLATLNKPRKTRENQDVCSRWQRAENLECQLGSASHACAGTLTHTLFAVVCLVVFFIFPGGPGRAETCLDSPGSPHGMNPAKQGNPDMCPRWQRAENLGCEQGGASHACAVTLTHTRGLPSCV